MSFWEETKAAMPVLGPLDLSSKEAYLSWVGHWKNCYKQLSSMIREAKAQKRYHRDQARIQPCKNESQGWHRGKMHEAHRQANYWGWNATIRLEGRHEGKRRSWLVRCELLAYEEDAGTCATVIARGRTAGVAVGE